ncbi:MAG: flagellar biosynthesis anti-sigma factor FlgM [Clostridiales bacterium]|nr:flagellar biosynthesis anti-sigma factor FlgM [Clostridiales bacterium]
MKINGVNSINVINNYKGNVEKINEKKKVASSQDVIEISEAGKTLNTYGSDPVKNNAKRIQELREQIKNGTYNVDPMETAKSMVNYMGDKEI